jgi:hypothetical protein
VVTVSDRSLPVPADTPAPRPDGGQDHPLPVPSGTDADLLPCTVHDIGTRKGVRVRTACSTSSGPHGAPCPCRQFTPGEES